MKKIIVVLCILALSVSCAWADIKASESRTRDIVLEGVQPEVYEFFKGDFPVAIASDKDVYNQGDDIVLTFKAEQDSYLTILDFTPSGQIITLFPNQWVTDNHVKAGEEVKIPAAGQNFVMKAGGAGVDIVRAIATNSDVEILDPDNQQLAGPFSVLKDARAGTRDILLLPANPDPELKWSVASAAVMTQGLNDEPSGFAAVQAEAQSAKMWANATTYLNGELVLLSFLSDKPAKLVSLVNIGTSEAQNNLLPDGTEIDINAGEILVLPRQDDKWKLVAAGKAGVDVVNAKLVLDDGSEVELSLKVAVEEDM